MSSALSSVLFLAQQRFRFPARFRFVLIKRARAAVGAALHTGRMASRSLSRLAHCSSRVFMVEINQKTEPVYFALSSEPRAHPGELEALFGSRELFSVCALCDDRVQSALCHARLKTALTAHVPSGCDVFDAASFLPDVKNSLVRGFLLRDDSGRSCAERVVAQLQQEGSVCALAYTRDGNGHYLCSAVSDEPAERERVYYVTPAPAPLYHPSTLNIINSDVFYHMEDAYKVLQEVMVRYGLGLFAYFNAFSAG